MKGIDVSYQTFELLGAIRSRDAKKKSDALENIYVNNYPIVQKFILANGGNSEEAKDIFQEGMILLYTHIVEHKFREEASISTYLFSICKNLWYLNMRKNKRKNQQIVKQVDEEMYESEAEPVEDRVLSVFKLFNNLGGDCKKVLELFYFEKYSMKDIAREFGLKGEQPAKNKKSRCLKKLRTMIEKDSSVYSMFINKLS